MKKTIRQLIKLIKKPFIWISHVLGGEVGMRRRRANKLARMMRSELTRLGFWERTKKGKKKVVQYEEPLLMTKDELWAPLNLSKFPHRKTTNDLRDPDVLQSLTDRCNATVKVDKLANGKLCLVTRLRPAQFPASYSINAFKLPPDAPILAFPLGIDVDGDHRFANLEEEKHLLVAGLTGKGKTTFLHTMLYTFISRNSQEDVELWLIDLKGQEFGKYEKLRGSKSKPGIVRHFAHEPEQALDVLDQAVKEIKRRNKLMKQYDASNLDDLMHLSGQRLRRIVVAMDEVAVLTLNRERIGKHTVGSWAQHHITQIAALGRAAGVHSVVATQHISKEVLTGLILANFETRVCFSTADWRKSQLVIETSEADGIPTGRMFYRRMGQTYEHQSPNITGQQIRLEVTRVAQHGPDGGLCEQDELRRFVKNAKLVVKVACEQMEGACTTNKLAQLEGIRGVISKHELIDILQRLEKDGILEAGNNRKPRRVTRGYFGMPELLDARYGKINEPEDDLDTFQDEQDETETQPEHAAPGKQHFNTTKQRLVDQDGIDNDTPDSDPAFRVREKSQHARPQSIEEIESQISQTIGELGNLLSNNPELADDIPAPFRNLFGDEPAPARVPRNNPEENGSRDLFS